MKRRALLLAFVLGVAIGAAGILFLDMRMRATYRRVLQSNFLVEQDLLAARTARQGDQLHSMVYRWNAVDASSEEGFRIFRADPEIDNGFFLPFMLLGLRYIIAPVDPSDVELVLVKDSSAGSSRALSNESVPRRRPRSNGGVLKTSSGAEPSKRFTESLMRFLRSRTLTLPSKPRSLYSTARARLRPDDDDLGTEDSVAGISIRCVYSRLQRTALRAAAEPLGRLDGRSEKPETANG